MIRNDNEYARALERVEQEKARFADIEQAYRLEFNDEQVRTLMEPLESFHGQLVDEIRVYERLKRGDLGDLTNLHGMGRLLIHVRISLGISQRELARRLNVNESQVSRDERNEYHGITMDRAAKILDALGAKLLSSVVEPAGACIDRSAPTWNPPQRSRDVTPNTKTEGRAVVPSETVLHADAAYAA